MPRKHKRQRDDSDQEIEAKDKKGNSSKWAAVLKQPEEDEEEELMPKKKAFDYDFSQEHRLYNEKQPPKKQEPQIVLTPQQQAALNKKLQKQRIQKQQKQKAKRAKRQQKKKVLQKQKEQAKQKKQEEFKQQKQLEKVLKHTKANSDSKKIIMCMLTVLILLGILQYQKDIHARLSKFRINTKVDFYSVLETSSSVSDSELKQQYKKLVVKYHPDKNPNCHSCKEKFNSIMEAWEVLGNSQKRKSYDENTGFLTQIPSSTLTLKPDNYQWLVGNSDSIWLIQVYDSTNQFCHYFGKFWQQFAAKQKGLINMGRIDIWEQSQMKSYIPFRFQIFPGLYTMYKGQERMCQLDFERPYRSLELCIEEFLQEIPVIKINDWSEIPESSKLNVILGGKAKWSAPIKLVHTSFTSNINFFSMPNDNSATVLVKGKNHKFQLNVGTSRTIFPKYRQFLEGIVTQSKSQCQTLHQCKQRPCLLLLNPDYSIEQNLPFPLIKITPQGDFLNKIQHIKNITGLNQKFDLGYYQDGKIQLGYFNEILDLRSQNGEVIDLYCSQNSYLNKVFEGLNWLSTFNPVK